MQRAHRPRDAVGQILVCETRFFSAQVNCRNPSLGNSQVDDAFFDHLIIENCA